MNTSDLLAGLATLQKVCPNVLLVPQDGNKIAVGYHLDWQNRVIVPRALSEALSSGQLILPCKDKSGVTVNRNLANQVKGYALLCGKKFTYQIEQVALVAVDIDGPGGRQCLDKILGTDRLPKTVAWTSGKEGYRTYLYKVPATELDNLRTVKKVEGTDKLELRFKNLAVTIPPSAHPQTGQYRHLDGCAFDQVPIADLPDKLYQVMLKPEARPKFKSLDDISLPVLASVPLIECCRKDIRDLISAGVPEGSGHNDAAILVAQELVAVESYLIELNQAFDRPAELYYEEFLLASGIDLNSKSMGRIKWARQRTSLEPSCKPEGVDNCIKGWYWREILKREMPTKTRTRQDLTPEQHKTIWDEMVDLYEQKADQQSIESRLMAMAIETRLGFRDVKSLYASVVASCEKQIAYDFASDTFKKFLAAQATRIELHEILPKELADQLTVASHSKCHPLRYLAYLWPAMANLVGGKAFVWASQPMRWAVDFVFFSADVGPSSSGKTPAAQDIMFYLEQKMAIADREWQEKKNHLAALKQAWKEMNSEERQENADNADVNPKLYAREMSVQPCWLFNDPTIAALTQKLQQQPVWFSSIWFSKELASILSSLDQFKSGGRGNDRQFLLDAYDGRIYRRSERKTDDSEVVLRGQSIQLVGGTQMDVLRRYLSLTEYQDGLTNRFLMSNPPSIPNPDRMPLVVNNAREILTRIYQRIESIPLKLDEYGEPMRIGMTFETDAQLCWESCWVSLRKQIKDFEQTDPNFASYLGKLVTYFVRIAGILSLIWQAVDDESGQLIPDKIPIHIVEKTWKLIEYYAGQYLQIRSASDNSERSQTATWMASTWIYVQNHGSITARDCQRFFGANKMTASQAKEILYQLAENGCGEIEQKGRSLILKFKAPVMIERITFERQPVLTINSQVIINDGNGHSGVVGKIVNIRDQIADVSTSNGIVPTLLQYLEIQNDRND